MGDKKELPDVSKIFRTIGRRGMKQTGAVHAEAGILENFGFLRFMYGCEPTKYLHLYAMPLENSYGIIALSAILDKGCLGYLTEEEHKRIFTENLQMYDGGAFWLCGKAISEDDDLSPFLTCQTEKDIIFDAKLVAKRKLLTDEILCYTYAKQENREIEIKSSVLQPVVSACSCILEMDKSAIKEMGTFKDGSKQYLLNIGKELDGKRIVKRLFVNAVETEDGRYAVLYYIKQNGQRVELPDRMEEIASLFQVM